MEMSSATPFYGTIKSYWRRRQYQRLDVNGSDTRVIRLGGKRKRTWNIKAFRKIRLGFKIVSPFKILAKVREGYINMMLSLTGNVSDNQTIFGQNRIPKSRSVRKITKADEIQGKLIFEIYKSLKASRELASA
ncbi:hypothetical protein ACHQM5_005625 [Ranunculus cassubicifolius]